MGYLKMTFGGEELPVKITNLERNPIPTINNNTLSVESGDGLFLLNSNYKEKIIAVNYIVNTLTVEDAVNFRLKMSRILGKKEPQKLIFSDEPNKYYNAIVTGTPTFSEDAPRSSGAISFLIPEGVAHSLEINQVTATTENGILTAHVDNEGSADVFPVYRIKHVTENGYLGIVHSGGALEVGNRDEVDAVPYQQSEMLADSFSPFVPYTGLNPENPLILNNGSLSQYADGYLRLSSAGTGSFYHGGSYKWDVPADSNGDIGAVNFYTWFRIQFVTGRMGQTGLIQVLLADKNNKLIAGIGVQKNDTVGNKAYAQTWVGGNNPREVHNWFFEPTMWPEHNPFNAGRGEDDILKIGETIRFHYWGKYYEVIVPELKEVEVASVQVFIGQYGNRNASNQLVSTMGVGGFKGRKDFVAKQRDIPNRYSAGSEIVIDTSSDSITVDGLPANDELVDGSTFAMLPPGGTDIEFYPSAWCEVPPEVTVEYRKRWL